jgi:putative ABC transport system permease protein
MDTLKLWLRWSWRDLRARWLQVAAIALIIALGTGVYGGLGANAPWRKESYDDSYALLNMYDLRVKLGESFVSGNDLLGAVRGIPHRDWIRSAEVRLIASTLVDASTAGKTVLVPGRVIGVDVAGGGPDVNGLHIESGRAMAPSDAGRNVAVLEYHFAKYYGLPPSGRIVLSGGAVLEYVGQGMTPEYFMVMTDSGGMMAESNFAAVFVPLQTAQALTGYPGMVNDLVLTLQSGADREAVREEIAQALSGAFPEVAASFMTREDDDAYNELYNDVDGDQSMYMVVACLFLAGAAFGAFNLASRMVEAQRREIGIGMALGMPDASIAVRPLLVAFQIAVLGVLLGIGTGLFLNRAFGMLLQEMMPMPVFRTPFQPGLFAQAAVLGIAIPFAATLYPVWRAVRVAPVDAIQTGHLVSKGGGLAPALSRVPLPGGSFVQMPVRNVLRSPYRTFLTLAGITIAVTLLVAILGMLDSMMATIRLAKTELEQNHPDRMEVDLDRFYPVDWIQNVRSLPTVADAEAGIQVGGYVSRNGVKLETILDAVDLDSALWKPTITAGERHSDQPGIILSEKAAHDLGVKPGDTITLTYPSREGLYSFHLAEKEMKVVGLHALPVRAVSYLDISQAGMMGLGGLTNVVWVEPAAGASRGEVERALFDQAGVASIQPVAGMVDSFSSILSSFIGVMYVVAFAVSLLAFLITFNSTSINVDERAREIATMFAFGLPVRTATRMAMLENLIMGGLGTVLGLGLGYAVLVWMMTERMATQLRTIQFLITISPETVAAALGMGVIVVALTPLLSIRKMAGMDIPSTLRVME